MLREHRVFLYLLLFYFVVGLVLDVTGMAPGLTRTISSVTTYLLIPPLVPMVLFFGFLYERTQVRVDGQPVQGWTGWQLALRSSALSWERVAGLCFIALAIPAFMNLFAGYKAAIPVLHPFALDAHISTWDRAVHGADPWRLLHPWLGHPLITRTIDRCYAAWILIIPGVILWQGWSGDRRTRAQFFVAFVLAWMLLGSGLATLLSSAGPCFYGRITGQPDPYAPLLAYLRSLHEHQYLSAIGVQDVLWQVHSLPEGQAYLRISAMPSMHVAMPVLYTLTAWRNFRWLAVAFGLYTGIVFLGSVHLAWHYALDGEVSLLLMPVLWWLAGLLTRDIDVPPGSGKT